MPAVQVRVPATHAPTSVPHGVVAPLVPHVEARHTLPEQIIDEQSASRRHALVAAHAPQVVPPQSMSVSSPFCTPSPQPGAVQTFGMVVEHEPLVQSPLTMHERPSEHVAHMPPPQSTSVSAPLRTVSLQVAA
jgi:hypothetical protein